MNPRVTFTTPSTQHACHFGRCHLMFLTFAFLFLNSTLSHATRAQDSDTFYGTNAGHNVTGTNDSAFGLKALYDYLTTTDSYNLAFGSRALPISTYDFDLFHNTAIGRLADANGDDNTTVGTSAGSVAYCPDFFDCYFWANTTAVGSLALGNNMWTNNTGTGYSAINDFSFFSGDNGGGNNTGNGYLALHRVASYELESHHYAANNTSTGALTIGSDLTFIGGLSYTNDNTADGAGALQYCTTGSANTAIGVGAIYNGARFAGSSNDADGWNALLNNYGSGNVAGGYVALSKNTGGAANTALGDNALLANTTGNTNIALGNAAGSLLTTGANNIDIGNQGVVGESNTIRIGTKIHTVANIAAIRGITVASGIAVMIDAVGRLGTTSSSANFKEQIKPMAESSEAIYSLHPVTFRYKREFDPAGIPQFGLVAEEVATVDPDLVARDEEGKPYTVRYEAVSAMLLNEFLKQHRKVEDQARTNQEQLATNKELQSALARQNVELDALAAQIAQ